MRGQPATVQGEALSRVALKAAVNTRAGADPVPFYISVPNHRFCEWVSAMRKVGKFQIHPRGLRLLYVSAVRTACYLLLAVWTIGLFNPGVAQDEGKARIEKEPINLDVIVNDRDGKRILELNKEDFEIYEDGVLQEITRFKPAQRPLRIILLFDMSVSMGETFPSIKSEAVRLVESMDRLDELMVASFDMDLRWRTNWAGKALATTEILDLKLGSVRYNAPERPFPAPPQRRAGVVDRNTNLYGAMHNLFERFGGRGGNEVALLFSDGVDKIDPNLAKQRPVNDSKQVIQKAQESWTQIYSACFKTERKRSWNTIPIGTVGYGSNCKFLSEVADATGGRSFEFESQPELSQVLKKTLDDLRSQYSLAYFPSSQGNRVGFHKIKVVVKKPELIARAREGYLISK